MRTLFATLLITLAIGTTSVNFAATIPGRANGAKVQASPASVSLMQIVKSKLDVVVQKEDNARMRIFLLDATGRRLSTTILPQKEVATRVRFDLAPLKDGTYFVKVKKGKHTQVMKFGLETPAPAQVLAADQKITLL